VLGEMRYVRKARPRLKRDLDASGSRVDGAGAMGSLADEVAQSEGVKQSWLRAIRACLGEMSYRGERRRSAACGDFRGCCQRWRQLVAYINYRRAD
jgi:hypothetical protein